MFKLKTWQQLLFQIVLFLIAIVAIVPLLGVFSLAFDGAIKGAPTEFRIFPEEPTFQVFRKMWHSPSQTLSFTGLIRNSLIVSLGAALIAIISGASMAYAFARFRFPGRQTGLFGLLVGALLPPVALMTPLYILLTRVGIRDSLFGLMVVYTSFSMPFCIWNMRAAFQSISKELEESAFLDGATPMVAFLRISLPLALPSIGVAALVAFLAGYTEFAIGWLFIENSRDVTIAMALWGMLSNTTWSELAALSILMSIPVVVIFYALQRYLLNRLLIGVTES